MSTLRFYFFILLLLFNSSAISAEKSSEYPFIIYFKGSCSAGKTTFIQTILNQWENVEFVDEDAIMQKSYVEAIADRFPDKFNLIKQAISQQNLYHAIREKDILFKTSASEEERKKASDFLSSIQEELNKSENISWKQEVSRSIDLEVLKLIKRAIELRKIVLLDSWYIKPKHLSLHFPETRVVKVLLYCPLKRTYERFMKRNKDSLIKEDLSERRYIRQLVGTFISLYEISAQPQQPIEQVKKTELESVFSEIASLLKDGPNFYHKPIFTFEELSKPYFLKLTSEFLLPFESAGSSSTFYINPREKYDIILDSTIDGHKDLGHILD